MDPTCIAAAAFFVAGNAISITYMVRERKKSHFDYEQFTLLDPNYIQEDWKFRRHQQKLEIAGGFMNAFSWLLLAIPMIQVCIILSQSGTRQLSTHMSIAVLVCAGCAMEFLARFMHLGILQWGNWLSKEYNMENWTAQGNDNIGWRTLEVSHLVNYGTVVWIDSFEFLCLGLALILFYASVNSLPPDGPRISRPLAGFGLFIGLFSLADFVSGVLRLRDWGTFRILTMLISVINRTVLLPIFLLVLGRQLPFAMTVHKDTLARSPAQRTGSRHWSDSPSGPAVEMVSTGD